MRPQGFYPGEAERVPSVFEFLPEEFEGELEQADHEYRMQAIEDGGEDEMERARR